MNEFSKTIKLAIKLEEDGIDFYQKAAEKTSHLFGKKMFLSFAEDEKRHLTVLKEILVDLKFSNFSRFFEEKRPKEKIKTIFREIKNESKEIITANPDELEVLKIGMGIESKSVKFYLGSLEKTRDSYQKAFFERLIEEEKEHYEFLQNTYSYLKDSGEWFLWEEKALLDGG